VIDPIAAIDIREAIIEGEIVALDEKGRSSFQMLQAFDLGTKRPPIIFYAFDLLRLNGKDLQSLPIEERKAELEGLLKRLNDWNRLSRTGFVDLPDARPDGQPPCF
jgi:bifunctional non-homologous end joining protein LigD